MNDSSEKLDSITFNEALKHSFQSFIDSRIDFVNLEFIQNSEEHKKCRSRYEHLFNQLVELTGDWELVDTLISEQIALHSMELEATYRAGILDGLRLYQLNPLLKGSVPINSYLWSLLHFESQDVLMGRK